MVTQEFITGLDYDNVARLSYSRVHPFYVHLFLDGIFEGGVDISIDYENGEQEYLDINNEVVYLSSIKEI